MSLKNDSISLFREISDHIIVYHNRGETPFVKVPHLHSQYEFCYNIFGAKSFFISGRFYSCRPHDLFLIPKTQIHKIAAMPGVTYERCIINIAPEVIDTLNVVPSLGGQFEWMDSVGDTLPHRVSLNEHEHAEYMRLVAEWEQCDSQIIRMARLLELLELCGKAFESADNSLESAAPDTWSDKVIEIIERDFRTITISDIASELYLSDDYLCKIFRTETGMNVGKYITLRRIAESKRLLYLGASVKEACAQSGFGDYSNFIRTFKKLEGYPPGSLDGLNDPL